MLERGWNMKTILWRVTLLAATLTAVGCGTSRKIEYSVPTLIKSLKDADPNMRYWAAQSLGSLGPEAEEAVPDLLEALTDEQAMVRMGAALALGEIHQSDALPALRRAERDPDEDVRA